MTTFDQRLVRKYKDLTDLAKSVEAQKEELRRLLLLSLEEHGEVDEKGNLWFPAEDLLAKKERRVSVRFDEDKAREWLTDNGWWDEAKVTVPEQVIPEHDTITEEAVAGFLWDHRDDDGFPRSVPDELYDVRETFALRVLEEEQYDY